MRVCDADGVEICEGLELELAVPDTDPLLVSEAVPLTLDVEDMEGELVDVLERD